MVNTTIQTDKETLSYIKIYCELRKIPQPDFVRHISFKDKDFSDFVKRANKI